jgi:hypothetical protein
MEYTRNEAMRVYAVVARRKSGRGVWRFIKSPLGELGIYDLQREAFVAMKVESDLVPYNEYRVVPIDVPKPDKLVAGE